MNTDKENRDFFDIIFNIMAWVLILMFIGGIFLFGLLILAIIFPAVREAIFLFMFMLFSPCLFIFAIVLAICLFFNLIPSGFIGSTPFWFTK